MLVKISVKMVVKHKINVKKRSQKSSSSLFKIIEMKKIEEDEQMLGKHQISIGQEGNKIFFVATHELEYPET